MEEEDLSAESAYRLGSLAVGLLAGLVLGLVVAVLLAAALRVDVSFPLFVFGGAASGAILGYLSSGAGFGLAGAVVHFLVGLVSAAGNHIVWPNSDAPA